MEGKSISDSQSVKNISDKD